MIRLLLDRNLETSKYELKYAGKSGNVMLSSFDTLGHALERSQNYAKRYKGELLISKFCISDWYCGVPQHSTVPEVLQEPPHGFSREVIASYRVLEGPFDSEAEATEAKFQLIAILDDI